MPKVFISYRRDDSQHQADRIFDALTRVVPRKNIFIDIDGIPAGVDFVDHLNQQVEKCDTLLALIGPEWLSAHAASGQRRLDDPGDFVRIEIAAALKRGITVAPVLLDGATMPHEKDLPADIKQLARRNAIEIRRNSFESDAQRMMQKLGLRTTSGKALAIAGGVGGLAFVAGAVAWMLVVWGIPGAKRDETQDALLDKNPAAPASVAEVSQPQGTTAMVESTNISAETLAAITRAREAEKRALNAAAEARKVALLADQAAANARQGGAGTIKGSDTSRHWESQGQGVVKEGYGVLWTTAGIYSGDSYRGSWKDNVRSGVGVYTFSENSGNRNPDGSYALRLYEGQYRDGKRNGVGLSTWRSKKTYAGEIVDALASGVGVARFEDGSFYEGEWKADTFHGHGVWRNANGSVRDAGVWADGIIVRNPD